MTNEINVLDQVVDMALSGGIFREKGSASAAINAIGVIKAQVPKILQENEELKQEVEKLQEAAKSKKPVVKELDGKPKKVETK